ncbi:MAG: hypothetical protein ABW123_05335 [Cystobacter sp.]
MNRRFLYCVLQGPAFSPSLAAARTGLELVDANEPGDVPPSGRYDGKALAEGSALLVLHDDDLSPGGSARESLGALQDALPELRALGATRLSLSLVVAWSGACHFALSAEELSALSALGLPLEVSCHPAAT